MPDDRKNAKTLLNDDSRLFFRKKLKIDIREIFKMKENNIFANKHDVRLRF